MGAFPLSAVLPLLSPSLVGIGWQRHIAGVHIVYILNQREKIVLYFFHGSSGNFHGYLGENISDGASLAR